MAAARGEGLHVAGRTPLRLSQETSPPPLSLFSFLLNRSAPRTGHPGPYGAARLAGLGTVIVYWDATERARGSPPPQAPVRD